MKYLNKIILLAMAFVTWNCDDKIDEISPENDLSADVIFSNFSTIEATTVGIYSGMQDGDFIGQPEMIADFMADNVNFVGSFTTLQDIRDFDANATNNTINGMWFDIFDVIRDANNIIVNLPGVNQEDVSFVSTENSTNFESLRTQFIGEAHFSRALATFQGVNLFAQPFQVAGGSNPGMPLVTEFFEGDVTAFQQPRATVNDTHSFIESDLIVAMNSLPETNGIRPSSTSAKALLSRLYLYREQWNDAANMANEVINTTGFSLAPDYSFYNNSSTEHIFRVINQADDGAFGNNFDTFYNPTSNNGRGDLAFSEDLISAFEEEPDDLRFELSFVDVDAGDNEARFTTKYPFGATNESDPNVLRMGEMYLNRAEANLRGGTNIGDTPLNDVNAIRERAGLDPLTTVTLDDILVERRKELAFEGHRRMDLLRNDLNLKPDNGAISAPGSDKVILPLPTDELNGNPNATQNPSY
ncbi:RagB/SusD family nutrient uptake outer membrane protein [Aggregatimonas sangjinii]|uniref:RagB/SusD family nutrient uptake outer membrane protein n=1 Tax=Aggregatimonas sangjinii TaxID=2583587 RepID=A0A5B7SJZ4_9FLAO|nr:RagB/SusD family nutrient uptake outer membrane protein [Aggregatimonas sangjinii]QCW98895.1 RagB/SusD family nutrient uptake outer membrane protein [Aggregatimonas sangjinii]